MGTKEHKIYNGGYQSDSPLFFRASGNYLFDADGTKFIDMSLGAGSLILGHSHSAVVEAVQEQAERGSLFLQNQSNVQQHSELVNRRTEFKLPNHIYCNSGSEATQRAIRLARAATGKQTIVSFNGAWHGMNEWTLFEDGGRFAEPQKPFLGIPNVVTQVTRVLAYNDSNALSEISSSNDIAAVIIEPVQGSNPQPDIKEYLLELVDICQRKNVLVIFDEIITGFRLSSGGAITEFNIVPDIATYGKVIGGGLPIGLVAFNDRVLENTFNDHKPVLTGGTFSANPLCTASGLAALSLLDDQQYLKIAKLGDYFRINCNRAFASEHIPFRCDGIKSINRIYFTDITINSRAHREKLEAPLAVQKRFRSNLWDNAIIWPSNGIVCHSTCQDTSLLDVVIDNIVTAAHEALS